MTYIEMFTFIWRSLFNNAFLCASFSISKIYDWVGMLSDNKLVPYKLLSFKKVEQFVQLQTFYKSQIRWCRFIWTPNLVYQLDYLMTKNLLKIINILLNELLNILK